MIKNMTRLNDPNSRTPFVLKIVNDQFSEVMKQKPKEINPEVEAAKQKAQDIVNQIYPHIIYFFVKIWHNKTRVVFENATRVL